MIVLKSDKGYLGYPYSGCVTWVTSIEDEYYHQSPTGDWTGKVFNLEG